MATRERKFSDLDLSFTPHPDTGDIVPLRGDRAIARAVRQVVVTNWYEKPYKNRFGANIVSQLFENFTPLTYQVIQNRITETIREYEKRVQVTSVELYPPDENNLLDQNTLGVVIRFNIVGQADTKQVTFTLTRVR